jgi:hypothetical protein
MFLGMSPELWFFTTILPASLSVGVWVWTRYFLKKT